MQYYFQDSSNDEFRVPHALLLVQLETTDGFLKDPGAVTKTTGQTIAVTAGTLIVALVVTPSATMTLSVGTSAAGTDILATESLTGTTKQVFVVNHHFTSAGTLHFTLSTGSISVHVKKL